MDDQDLLTLVVSCAVIVLLPCGFIVFADFVEATMPRTSIVIFTSTLFCMPSSVVAALFGMIFVLGAPPSGENMKLVLIAGSIGGVLASSAVSFLALSESRQHPRRRFCIIVGSAVAMSCLETVLYTLFFGFLGGE